MNYYSTTVSWSPEDEGYIAVCPELGDISAFGETREEALREIEVVIKITLEYLVEKQAAVPKPDVIRTYSGQFVIRIPSFLHARLVGQAKRNRVSLNSLVTTYLAEASAQSITLESISKKLSASRQLEFLYTHVKPHAPDWNIVITKYPTPVENWRSFSGAFFRQETKIPSYFFPGQAHHTKDSEKEEAITS